MKVIITSIELKNPFKFFVFAYYATQVVKQLKTSNHKDFKNKGFWTKFYTMTLWNNETDIIAFAKSGAHLESMNKSKSIAKEIWTYTYETDNLPNWDEAKILLKKGKVIKF